jgi:hypothetical protein
MKEETPFHVELVETSCFVIGESSVQAMCIIIINRFLVSENEILPLALLGQ